MVGGEEADIAVMTYYCISPEEPKQLPGLLPGTQQ